MSGDVISPRFAVHGSQLSVPELCTGLDYVVRIGKSKKGRKVDALAHRGDEGRDKLR